MACPEPMVLELLVVQHQRPKVGSLAEACSSERMQLRNPAIEECFTHHIMDACLHDQRFWSLWEHEQRSYWLGIVRGFRGQGFGTKWAYSKES